MTAIINDKGVVGDASGGAAVTDRGLVGYQPTGVAIASDRGLAFELGLAFISTTTADTTLTSDGLGQRVTRNITDTTLTSDAAVRSSQSFQRIGVNYTPAEPGNMLPGVVEPAGGSLSLVGWSEVTYTFDSIPTRTQPESRAMTDTTLTSDAVSSAAPKFRSCSDTTLTSDAVSRTDPKFRAMTDVTLTSDAISFRKTYVICQPTNAAITDYFSNSTLTAYSSTEAITAHDSTAGLTSYTTTAAVADHATNEAVSSYSSTCTLVVYSSSVSASPYNGAEAISSCSPT